MGGHGGLNILPQKKWNVYNRDNRERVEKDERAQAARQEEELQKRREKELDRVYEQLGISTQAYLKQEKSSATLTIPSQQEDYRRHEGQKCLEEDKVFKRANKKLENRWYKQETNYQNEEKETKEARKEARAILRQLNCSSKEKLFQAKKIKRVKESKAKQGLSFLTSLPIGNEGTSF